MDNDYHQKERKAQGNNEHVSRAGTTIKLRLKRCKS
jgi:hypothetical protein